MNRKPIIATVAAGLLIAGLPSAVAAAAPEGASCTQWGFNGATSLGVPGGFISFYATGPSPTPGPGSVSRTRRRKRPGSDPKRSDGRHLGRPDRTHVHVVRE